MLLTSIIWFILGSLVTVIIMYRLRPGITVKEIDPIVSDLTSYTYQNAKVGDCLGAKK
jgi:hypothetical protein